MREYGEDYFEHHKKDNRIPMDDFSKYNFPCKITFKAWKYDYERGCTELKSGIKGTGFLAILPEECFYFVKEKYKKFQGRLCVITCGHNVYTEGK